MNRTLKDFVFRKALAWKGCHKMKKLWKSNLGKTLNIRIVKVTIETILLYGNLDNQEIARRAVTFVDNLKEGTDL